MVITREEENKARLQAGLISGGIFALLLLLLFLIPLITPNPPFPLNTGGGGGMEINFGTYNEGTGNVEENGIGNATSVVENVESQPTPENPTKEEIYTSENGEEVPVKETKPEVKNYTTVITPTKPKEEVIKPKEKTAAEKLKEKFLKNQGKNGGGDGNSGQAGNAGDPSGDPFKNGTGGTGTGSDGGNGPGKGPGNGPGFGGGKFGFDLGGRSVLTKPKLPSDTKEEGKVVVEIVVDKEGNVIEANPIGRGTTTNSALLKAKARQAAMATKFNANGQFEEQKGTITIVFAFE